MTNKERKQFAKMLKRIDWIVEHGTAEQQVALVKVIRILKRLKDTKMSGAKVSMKDVGSDIWFVIDGGKNDVVRGRG